jgi:hypothetical protein
VLARLATGGAANIFLARQPGAAGFNKLVCLKTLLPERASDADFVAMFLDEARLAARLNHPNCVQIYDLGRVRGVYYISMEYIFGDTLWNLLTTVTKLRTPLPASHVAAIIASGCDGLHHAHELKDGKGRPYNLVHRDVSPQNIMVTYEGQTKVVDFGIAKAETGRAPTIAGIVKGKFSYMSPEQITGGSVDRRSDIYSLGIVFFECLASRRLYRGDSPEDIARLILEHRAPRLRDVVPDIPAELDEICAKALARHPSKRYQTALEMGDALRDYLDSVRYNQSASSLAKLLEERFGDAVARRRKVFEAALAGTFDEQELVKALEARAVRNLDLFPDGDEPPPAENDFSEETSEHAAKDWKDPTNPPDVPTRPLHGEDPRLGMHSGIGFRVELQNFNPGESEPSDATTIDPTIQGDDDDDDDGNSEDLTTVNPEAQERETASFANASKSPTVQSVQAADSTQVDHYDPQDPRWSDDATKADTDAEEDFDDQTPFEGMEKLERNLGVVVTAASTPGNGAVITKSRSSPEAMMVKAAERSPDTVEEMEIPTKEEARALSDLQAFEPPEVDPADVVLIARSTNEVSPQLSQVTMPPGVQDNRRYTFAALLAAVGFGVSFGLVCGLLLARLIFNW